MPQLKDLFDLPEDLDAKSVQILLKAIGDRNQEGFDFLEFLASVDKLKAMPMDEPTAYKSAYATASTFGITKDQLSSSAQKYLGVLRAEYDQFKAALSRQITQRIDQPKQEIHDLKKRKSQIDQELEKLKREQSLIDEKVTKIENAVETEYEKLQSQENLFRTSYDAIKQAIESNMNEIENQL